MELLKVGTAHSHFIQKFGYLGAFEKLKECGFDSVDFSFYYNQNADDYILRKSDEDLKEFCLELKSAADEAGIFVGQTHAPYYFDSPERFCDEEFIKVFKQAIKATAYLGSKYIVIHPALCEDPENNHQRVMRTNTAFFKALQPLAVELGVTIAIENLCFVPPVKWPGLISATFSAAKLIELIDGLGEGFCACLDTGHAFFSGQEPATFARLLGNRLKVLHMQDGDGENDAHMPATLGRINWDEFLKALSDVNYQGVLNMEMSYRRFGGLNNILETGKFVSEIGREFARKIEAYKGGNV